MRILISQKTIKDRHGAELDALETAYIRFFRQESFVPDDAVFVPVPNNPENALRLVQTSGPGLVILTGGNNVDPRSFGSDVVLDDLAHNRDEVEKILFDYALANAIPVLAVCRGFHYVNVLLQGKLTLNIKDHPPAVRHSCWYEGREYTVNSFHNHAIGMTDLAAGLVPLVTADKIGTVEAYVGRITGSSGECSVLGVQWHPERPGADMELFKMLIKNHLFQERAK